MRFKHRYTFLKEGSINNIEEYLKSKKIKYKILDGDLITIEMYEDNGLWDELNQIMIKTDALTFIDSEYSRKEYDNALWLDARSKWRWEYPQPEDMYRHTTYDDTYYCSLCGCGLIQNNNFKIKKQPKWGSKSFLMLNWVHDELFINNNAAKILLSSNLKGFDFMDVKHFKSNEIIDDIKQIYIHDILKPGLIDKSDTISEEVKCNKCGTIKRITTGRGYIFKKEVFNDIKDDIVKSYEVFGDGNRCIRMIIVSKKFYDVIKENKLDKDVVFEPIMLY